MNLNEKRASAIAKLKAYQTRMKDGLTLSDDDAANVKTLLDEVQALDEQIAKANDTADLIRKIGDLGTAETQPTGNDTGDDGKEPVKARTAGDYFVKSYRKAGGARLKAGFAVEFKANTDVQTEGDSSGALAPYLTQTDDAVFPYHRPLVIADLFAQGALSGATTAVKYPVFGELEGKPGTVGEAGAKPQVHFPDPTWVTDDLKEVAAWFAVSDNMLEDLSWLVSEINDYATYNIQLLEESQLLSGDGSDNNVKGLLTREIQTLAKDTDSDPDRLFKTRKMISEATGFQPDGIVINPADYEALRLSKDNNGQYFGGGYFAGQYGNGGVMQDPPLWGLRTVVTEAIAQGTALVGAFTAGGKIFRKGGLEIASTNSHADYFTSDKVAIRLRTRLMLQVKYPKAFVEVELGKSSASSAK